MGLFDHFPYTNFHELNLDWIMEQLLTLKTTIEQFVSINALKYADPIQWNITSQYEKNTIVIDPLTGTAYISVQPVPAGVALTRTEYWTVVFDLGSFVVRAAKNFTNKYEEDTTLTATFPSAVNDWLIWGDTLYRVISNITAGDQYVIDSNIRHFTLEDIIGHLEDLTTSDKSNIVAAINEVVDIIGSLTDLTTEDKSNIVAAINEVMDIIGNETLTTTAQTLRGAVNELDSDIADIITNRPYVTPEMYGAAGDGVTDDTTAVQSSITSNRYIFMDGDYLVASSIIIPSDRVIVLNGSLIYSGADSAIKFSGSNILLTGIGSITSNGKYALLIEDESSIIEVSLKGKIYCRTATALAVIKINADAIGVTRLYFHDLYLVGGESGLEIAVGIDIITSNSGYANENVFDRISIMRCSCAIKIVNSTNYRIDNNKFGRIEAENSLKQLWCYHTSTGMIQGNLFEFRSDEYVAQTGIIDIDDGFTNNKFIFNAYIKPAIFTNTTTPTKALYTSNAIADNAIFGCIVTPSGTPIATNPNFKMNGDVPVFNFPPSRSVTGYIGASFTFDWTNTAMDKLPGAETYLISATICEIDLNYLSDHNTSPLRYLMIYDDNGCTLSIKNDTDSLFDATLLAKGLYKAVYSANKKKINLYKIADI